jgi:hypothetical protein
MTWKTVAKYALGYNIKKAQFYFYYWLEGDGKAYQIFPSPDQFIGLSDMFRNEGPVKFNTDGMYFVTAEEEVGDEEIRPGREGDVTKRKKIAR